MRQGQYFLVNIFALLFSISGGSETNSKYGWEAGWVGDVEELRVKLSQLLIKLKLEFKLSLEKITVILIWFLNLQIC